MLVSLAMYEAPELRAASDRFYEVWREHIATNHGTGRYVVLNKIDLTETREAVAELKLAFQAMDIPLLTMSSVSGEGVQEVLAEAWKLLGTRV